MRASELQRLVGAASARCEQAIAISRELLEQNDALRASVADTLDSIHRRRAAGATDDGRSGGAG